MRRRGGGRKKPIKFMKVCPNVDYFDASLCGCCGCGKCVCSAGTQSQCRWLRNISETVGRRARAGGTVEQRDTVDRSPKKKKRKRNTLRGERDVFVFQSNGNFHLTFPYVRVSIDCKFVVSFRCILFSFILCFFALFNCSADE